MDRLSRPVWRWHVMPAIIFARASPATQFCSSTSAVRFAQVHGIGIRGKHNQGTDVPRSPGTGEPRDVSLRFLRCCFSEIFSEKQNPNCLQYKGPNLSGVDPQTIVKTWLFNVHEVQFCEWRLLTSKEIPDEK